MSASSLVSPRTWLSHHAKSLIDFTVSLMDCIARSHLWVPMLSQQFAFPYPPLSPISLYLLLLLLRVSMIGWSMELVIKYFLFSTSEVYLALCCWVGATWLLLASELWLEMMSIVWEGQCHYQLSTLCRAQFSFYSKLWCGMDRHPDTFTLCKYPIAKIQSHIK